MAKRRSRYCRICRLVVAPNDPERLERHGKTAHEACVLNHELDAVREQARDFLDRSAVTFTANYFAELSEDARSREALARALSTCLNMALAEPRWRGHPTRRVMIENFARYAADHLFIDIPLDPE